MSSDQLLANAGLVWLVIGVVLAIAELAAPGVFLIFVAVAALITGVTAFALPDLPVLLQLLSFTLWSIAVVAIGRRWYVEFPVPSADPQLNDRAARLIGETVTVCEAIEGGAGRVRLGDGNWPAIGPDCAAGTRLRIAAVRGATLIVEPLPPGR